MNQTTHIEEPGFEPLAVVPREDGAYVVVPVNGGSTSTQLASLLNPSWQRQRGFQILRLDNDGQVLWQRMWTQRSSYNGFAGSQAMSLLDARLTADGGLALLSNTALFLDPNGEAVGVAPFQPPSGCLPEGASGSQRHAFFTDDGSLVIVFDRWQTGGSRACAIGSDGALIDVLLAEPGRAMDVVDFRRGVGFLSASYVFDQGQYTQRSTSLRSGDQTLWSRTHALELVAQLAIAPNGNTWLREGDGFLVLDRAGLSLANVPASQFTAPVAWLPGDDVLLGGASTTELRRLSALGAQRWSRPAGQGPLGDFGRWFLVADSARALTHLSITGEHQIRSVALSDGALLSEQVLARGFLAVGPLGRDRHLSVAPAPMESVWVRDFSTCGPVCDPHAFGVSSGLDIRVLDSTSGAQPVHLDPYQFGFNSYARMRERSPAVSREFSTEQVVHARYVSNGVKELLEVSRPDDRGANLWRSRLEFERFDVQNAALAMVDGDTYVAASAIGPSSQEHRLWKLDPSGTIAWTRPLAEPLQQLFRIRVANMPRACGMGLTLRPLQPAAAPVWQCFDANGDMVVDTRLWHVLASHGWEVASAQPFGSVVRIQDVPPASDSGTRLLFSEVLPDGLRLGGFSWQFDAPAADEKLKFDAIERTRGSMATALVMSAANPYARPRGLMLAVFDGAHQRRWQRRIDQELPTGDTRGIVSLVAQDEAGQHVYVAFHPRLENLVRPVRICRYSAQDGTPGPCIDTPFNARATALIPAADGQMLLWAQPLQDGLLTGIGLYPLSEIGVGPSIFWSSDHLMEARDNTTISRDNAWTVLEPRFRPHPSTLGQGSSSAVVAVSRTVLFANGFE